MAWFSSLYEFYDRTKQSQYLRGVEQYYGPILDKPILSYPAIVWVPTTDIYGGPEAFRYHMTNMQVEGKDLFEEQIELRKQGCELRIYAKDYHDLDGLINSTANAILEAAGYTWQNAQLVSGNYFDRDQLSQDVAGYSLRLNILIPVFHFNPAAIIQTETITTNVVTPD